MPEQNYPVGLAGSLRGGAGEAMDSILQGMLIKQKNEQAKKEFDLKVEALDLEKNVKTIEVVANMASHTKDPRMQFRIMKSAESTIQKIIPGFPGIGNESDLGQGFNDVLKKVRDITGDPKKTYPEKASELQQYHADLVIAGGISKEGGEGIKDLSKHYLDRETAEREKRTEEEKIKERQNYSEATNEYTLRKTLGKQNLSDEDYIRRMVGGGEPGRQLYKTVQDERQKIETTRLTGSGETVTTEERKTPTGQLENVSIKTVAPTHEQSQRMAEDDNYERGTYEYTKRQNGKGVLTDQQFRSLLLKSGQKGRDLLELIHKETPTFKTTSEETPYGLRNDGTPKEKGFLGPIKTKDGRIMTELSIGVNMGDGETEIPTLVPTLSPEQIKSLSEGKSPNDEIVKIAVEHAQKRIKEGKSPFWNAYDDTVSGYSTTTTGIGRRTETGEISYGGERKVKVTEIVGPTAEERGKRMEMVNLRKANGEIQKRESDNGDLTDAQLSDLLLRGGPEGQRIFKEMFPGESLERIEEASKATTRGKLRAEETKRMTPDEANKEIYEWELKKGYIYRGVKTEIPGLSPDLEKLRAVLGGLTTLTPEHQNQLIEAIDRRINYLKTNYPDWNQHVPVPAGITKITPKDMKEYLKGFSPELKKSNPKTK